MSRGMRGLAASLLGLSILVGSMRAQAGPSEAAAAEALFDEGKRMMAAKRFEVACPKFAESQRLDPGVGTALWLAECYAKIDRLASAWATFKEAEALASRSRDAGRAQVAREEAARLEPNLSRLVIEVPLEARVRGLEVRRDDVSLGEPLWGTAIPTDAGSHRVIARAPGKKPWEGTASVPTNAGTAKIAVPVLEDADQDVAPEAGDLSSGRTHRVVGLSLMGVGVVGVVIGTIFGLQVKPKADEADPFCQGNRCNQAGVDLRNDARSLAAISTVSFIVGAAFVTGGAVAFFTAPSGKRNALEVAPAMVGTGAGAVLGGSF